jgi:ATP-dependent DNA helicase RecG
MSPDSLKKLIAAGESQTLEFKASFSNEAAETIAAFSNTSGGTVLLGVADNGDIAGLTLTPEKLQQWVNEIKTKTTPAILPESEVITLDGKTVAALRVKEYPIKPVGVKGRYYKRVGNANHLMSPQEVAQAHFKTFNSSWDYTTDPEHTIADISITKIKKFVRLVNRGKKNKIKDTPLQVLRKLNLLRGKHITRACYLLFLKRESMFTAIELGRFQTPIIIKDGDRTKADLFTQVDAVFDFVTKHINKEYIITGKPQRDERWDYPLDALREIIINSIVHRDYSGPTGGIVKVYDDKIEISNTGRLPPGLTVPLLLSGKYVSEPRNPQVAAMFKEAGIIERYGSGIGRIIADFKEYGLLPPEFSEAGNSFIVTIYKKRISGFIQGAPVETGETTREKSNEKSDEKSNEKVLRLIAKNPAITTGTLSAKLNLSVSGIAKIIRNLKKKQKLRRIGPDKGGHWEVLPK